MPDINRRRFLIASAGVGAAGLLSTAVDWHDLIRAAQDNPLPEGAGVLVLVTLYGGNDGINTLIPYADNAYHDARPELAYAPGDVIRLDQQLGLNPALKGLGQLWDERHLAVVRGVGYPRPDHSHFRSMDIWQTASPTEPVSTGWIGRWLDATGDDPFVRSTSAPSCRPCGRRKAHRGSPFHGPRAGRPSGPARRRHGGAGRRRPRRHPAMAAVCKAYRAARTADKAFQPVKPAAGEHNSLAAQLGMVASAVKARVPTRVYTVQLGGFDTHADERGTQQRLLQTFDTAVTPFLRDMAGDRHGRNVVLMAYSEFGRRVRANASQGTDHGTAGPVFVAGAPVKGGFTAPSPALPTWTTETSSTPPTFATSTPNCSPTPSGRTRRRPSALAAPLGLL